MKTKSSAHSSLGITKKTTLRKKILSAAILQALVCSSGTLYAAKITVNSAADAVADDGNCTLREAIQTANTDAAVDTCVAGSGTDNISFDNALSGSTVTLGGSQLDITSDLTIDGDLDNDGAPDITIDAGGVSRAINIDATAATRTVTLEGLTISNGGNTDYGAGVNCQGNYQYVRNCNLTLSNSRVTGNTANASGGGIRVDTGALTITNSTVSGNQTTYSSGAGISTSRTSVNISDSTISNNTAGGRGGGMYIGYTGDITLTNSTVSGNTSAGTGGGIYGYGNITLTNSTVSGNTSSGSAGGINGYGNITLTNSTVSGNTASSGRAGGINASSYGNITLTNSTVSGNTASKQGGGMNTEGGNITLTNSTVSGNSAGTDGGGLYSFGSVSLTNSTITANSAANAGAGVFISPYGVNNNSSTISIVNSIIASNTPTGAATLADCVGNGATVSADTNNLVTDNGTNCGLSPDSTADPMLGALADNGGPTQTHLPQTGSPVLDAGDNASCPATDQRGANRDDGACDIGAVEGTVSLIPPTSIEFDSATATVSEDGGTVTLTLTRSGNTANAINVDYTTADGTATAPGDYTANSNTLSFAAGVTTQTVVITINDDTDVEGDEDFSVTLSNPQLVSGSGTVAMGANTGTTVTITDNDAADGGDTTSSTGSSDNNGFLGIGSLHPWWLLTGLAAWLRRKVRK